MSLLVTLAKYKTAIGEGNAANDTKHTEEIEDASAAVINYAQRDFGAATDPDANRTFEYDGSGLVEIDDATTINTVTLLPVVTVLTDNLWSAHSEGVLQDPLIYTYLRLPTFGRWSGEMGFTYNLDRYLTAPVESARVNADWGWPAVPDDVQRATIWTAAAFAIVTGGGVTGNVASESIAEVAYAYAQEERGEQALGDDPIPARAAALLNPYRRHSV